MIDAPLKVLSRATPGQILVSLRVLMAIEEAVTVEPVGGRSARAARGVTKNARQTGHALARAEPSINVLSSSVLGWQVG